MNATAFSINHAYDQPGSVGTHFVPTPGVEECSNYWLVLKMLEQRIRNLMTEEGFQDISRQLVYQFLTPPNNIDTPAQVEKWLDERATELYSAYATYEASPTFLEGLQVLVPYKGKQFSISSTTSKGIMVLIYI